MTGFWNTIIESNTFNFAILLLIFWILAVKFDLSDKLEKIKFNVAAAIEHAKLERKQAERSLNNTKREFKEADIEATNKINNAHSQAKGLYEDILAGTKIQIDNLNKMAVRINESQETKISNSLLSEVVSKAFKKAESDISGILEKDYDMQIKLIEESIKNLEGISL